MIDLRRNWSGSRTFQAREIHQPKTLDDLQRIVSKSERAKAIGSRHSFNSIADTSGDLISLEHFDHVVEIDEQTSSATVGGGMPYASFCRELDAAGYAVHNMASLPQITLAGACSTATHGSGDSCGNLATAVRALTLVTGKGELVTLDRETNEDDFRAVVVGIGAFGIITEMTLDLRPAFQVRQDIYEELPHSELWKHFDEIMSLGYSVSLFTDWQGRTVNQLWVKRIVEPQSTITAEQELYGAQLATVVVHPSPGKPGADCNDQLGAVGPWHQRLPHFRDDAVGPTGEDLQTEYFVDRRYAVDALQSVAELEDELRPLLKTSEIRTVAADDLWMSTAFESDCIGIHFSWQMDLPAVEDLMPLIEQQLRPFSPRPHWGKLFTMPSDEIASRYPRFEDFRAHVEKYDPNGTFRNEFLDNLLSVR